MVLQAQVVGTALLQLYGHLTAEKLDRFDVLESNLRKLIDVRPDHAHAYNALGYSFADRNVLTQSLLFNAVNMVVEVNPRDIAQIEGDKRFNLYPYNALIGQLKKVDRLWGMVAVAQANFARGILSGEDFEDARARRLLFAFQSLCDIVAENQVELRERFGVRLETEVRFALSKDDLKIKGMPRSVVICLSRAAASRVELSDSITQGPAIRTNGVRPPIRMFCIDISRITISFPAPAVSTPRR